MTASTTAGSAAARSTTAGTATTAAGTAGNANAGQSQAATEGQGSELKELLEAFKKQADGQSAVINRLQREIKALQSRGTQTETESDEGTQEGETREAGDKKYKSPYMRQLQELREFKASVENERASMLQETLVQNLLFGMTVKGVDAKLATLVAESLKGRVGTKVAMEKDHLGRSFLVVKGENEEENVPVEKWLDAFMQSDEGKSLLPKEPNPSLRGLPGRRGGSTEGKIRITKDDLRSGRFDMEAMKAGKIVVQE